LGGQPVPAEQAEEMLIHNRKDSIGLPLLPESPAADPKSKDISRILWALNRIVD
jgi:hypothetical protein